MPETTITARPPAEAPKIAFTVYDSRSGVVLRSGTCALGELGKQAAAGEALIAGESREPGTRFQLVEVPLRVQVARLTERVAQLGEGMARLEEALRATQKGA